MVLSGADGGPERADFGTAWPSLAEAMQYVAEVEAGTRRRPVWGEEVAS